MTMKISAHLKPNSRHREEVVVGDDGMLTIYIKAPAIEGRANAAAVKLLAKHFWCVALLRNTRYLRLIGWTNVTAVSSQMNTPAASAS